MGEYRLICFIDQLHILVLSKMYINYARYIEHIAYKICKCYSNILNAYFMK